MKSSPQHVGFLQQIRSNSVALLSLLIALSALFYSAWRNETSEHNENIRVASFELLQELGRLQTIVHFSYYGKNPEEKSMGNPLVGWGHVIMMQDLAMVIPDPIPEKVLQLKEIWQKNWGEMSTNQTSSDLIIQGIDQTRQSVVEIIQTFK